MNDGKNRMGPMGIAPKLLPVILPVLAAAAAASVFAPGWVSFEGKFRGAAFAAGIALGALSIPFYIDLAVRLLSALRNRRLAVRGTYAFCRHPLYAWWIFLVLPALTLLLDNWAFLLCSVAAFIAVKRYAGAEDEYLERTFGEEFRVYRKSTRELIPVPKRRRPLPQALGRFVVFCAAVGVYLVLVYVAVIRPAAMTFGATADEVRMALPGDDLEKAPMFTYTQAVTIDAPPSEVWKWLIQVGYRRAGWYNVDAVNGLIPGYFYEGNGSAKRIIPELQNVKQGDTIAITPGQEMPVVALEPERTLLLAAGADFDTGNGLSLSDGSRPAHYMSIVWGFYLRETPDGGTRLISRFRSSATVGFPVNLIFEIVDMAGGGLLQQPAMFHGIKARAEGRIR